MSVNSKDEKKTTEHLRNRNQGTLSNRSTRKSSGSSRAGIIALSIIGGIGCIMLLVWLYTRFTQK